MKFTRDHGFTLLELMVVVIVISLVLAVAYPSISRGSATLRLRSTARDVLSALRYAREKAVTEQTGMRIAVDRQKQELVLTDDLGDGRRRYAMPHEVKIQRMLLAGTEITEGPLLLRFLPNGSAEEAEILLQSQTGIYLRVVTDPVTGGARVEEGMGESFQ